MELSIYSHEAQEIYGAHYVYFWVPTGTINSSILGLWCLVKHGIVLLPDVQKNVTEVLDNDFSDVCDMCGKSVRCCVDYRHILSGGGVAWIDNFLCAESGYHDIRNIRLCLKSTVHIYKANVTICMCCKFLSMLIINMKIVRCATRTMRNDQLLRWN